MVSMLGRIPQEIIDALQKGKFSLTVKGNPGTGKTTFALELTNALKTVGFYISTRISSIELYEQFPWIKELIKKENIIDARLARLPQLRPTQQVIKLGNQTDFLRSLLDLIEKKKPSKGTIIIDSIEALRGYFNIPPENFQLETTLMEISDAMDANIIFVTERAQDSPLDYLVDGSIKLSQQTINGRLIRIMKIEKLRGVEISNPEFIFTLQEQHFTFFKEFEAVKYPHDSITFEPMYTENKNISSSNRELDHLLNDGFSSKDLVFLEISDDVPDSAYNVMVLNMIINFIKTDNFVVVPLFGSANTFYADILKNYFALEFLSKHIRFILNPVIYKEYIDALPEGERKLIFSADFTDEKQTDGLYKELTQQTGGNKKKIFFMVPLEWYMDLRAKEEFDTFLKFMLYMIYLKGNIGLIYTKSTFEWTTALKTIAPRYLKLEMLGKTILLSSEKPIKSNYYAVEIDNEVFPHVKLTKIA